MEKKNNKYIAGASLGVMAAGFAATLPLEQSGIVPFLQGAFEAGLVGGLADWFAVTALFRHPLGIPIPHTSLLVKNRDKLTKALVTAVETELLNPGSIAEKLKGINVTDKLLTWADKQLDAAGTGRSIAAVCGVILQHLPYEQIIAALRKEVRAFIEGIDAADLCVRASKQALDNEWDRKALDFMLDKADAWIVKPETRDMLGAVAVKALGNIQLGGFMGFAMGAFSGFMTEDKLGGIVQSLLLNGTNDLRREAGDGRRHVLEEIRSLFRDAAENRRLLDGIESLKISLADYVDAEHKVDAIVMTLKERAEHFVQRPGFAEAFALPFLKRLVRQAQSSEELIAHTEQWLQARLLQLIGDNHGKIGSLVKENVDKLDDRTLISMLEDKVGKDLQWIRVNGALCGFLIGLLLTVIKAVAG